MQKITGVTLDNATGAAKGMLEAVNAKFGMVPNTFATMAVSEATLGGFLSLNGALEGGILPFEVRNQIAILISQLNGCSYCLSAFTAIGKGSGASDETVQNCRMAGSSDPKIQAALVFAREIVGKRGTVSDEAQSNIRTAGYSDAEITEIVANVAMITFINYFNLVAGTDIDFPIIDPKNI